MLPESPERLFFCHIPKTGGVTLRSLLSEHFHQREIFPYDQWEDVPANISPSQLLSYRLYQGHFFWSSTLSLLGKPLPTITMLRNPLDRALSAYDHIRRSPEHPRHNLINGKNATLEDFLEKGLFGGYANTQVLFLSGSSSTTPTVVNAQLEYKNLLVRNPQYLSLEHAKEVLEQMEFFGITERFDDSIQLLFHRFGWAPPLVYERLNVGHERKSAESYPPALIDRLVECNRLDIELYEYGKKLFEARYRQFIADLQWESYNYRSQSLNSPPEIAISFDDAIEGYGWYPREFTSSGRCYRWSGPGNRSVLITRIAPAETLALSVGIYHVIAHELLDGLQIRINGTLVSLRGKFDEEQQTTVIQAEFEGSLVDTPSGVTMIEFCLERTVSANDLDSTNMDTRKLGIGYYWVKINPVRQLELTGGFHHL
ncbi:MAG: sulfotransferase family 2 domain-containing protein [Chloroflexota bacterium]